jgi:hypothetical protein
MTGKPNRVPPIRSCLLCRIPATHYRCTCLADSALTRNRFPIQILVALALSHTLPPLVIAKRAFHFSLSPACTPHPRHSIPITRLHIAV